MASDINGKIERINSALADYVDRAVNEAANLIADEMRHRVPQKTGTLMHSIEVKRISPSSYKISAGGSSTVKGGYDYSLGVEFGNHHSGAEPFFYPTYRAKKREAEAKIQKAIKDGIGAAG